MQVSLELSGHPKANVRSVLIGRTTVVGRSKDCGLQIASASVSRRHCEIRVNGESVSVVDLGSSNGTFIDSDRLPAGEEWPLRPGARLNVGGIRFLVSFSPAATPVDEDAPLAADEAVPAAAGAADEPIFGGLSDDEPARSIEPIIVDDALPTERTLELPASNHDFDVIDEAFGEPEPVLTEEAAVEEAAVEDEPVLAAEPILAEDEPLAVGEPAGRSDEPILGADEDDAFAFLMEDEDAAGPASSKK